MLFGSSIKNKLINFKLRLNMWEEFKIDKIWDWKIGLLICIVVI